MPVGVGVGIRDAETARATAQIADAVVVGSRMVQVVESSNDENLLQNVASLMTELKTAVDTANR
jgi:tryptophan synthase alpha chain